MCYICATLNPFTLMNSLAKTLLGAAALVGGAVLVANATPYTPKTNDQDDDRPDTVAVLNNLLNAVASFLPLVAAGVGMVRQMLNPAAEAASNQE